MLVSTSGDDGGAVIAYRLRHLLEAGWDVRLFCKGGVWGREPALQDEALRGRVQVAARARADSAPFQRRLRRLRPALVHIHSGHLASKYVARGLLPDQRLVVSFREDGQDLDAPELDGIWRRVTLALFPSDVACGRALDRGCPEERAEVLEPAIEIRPNGANGEGPLRLVSFGPLVWERGYEHSVHAVALLREMGVRCEYRIVGEGEHVQAVAFARHQLGLHDEVRLVAPDGKPLESADVFVDPAVSDSASSTALAAAQSSGVPYVATARREAPPEGGGIVVPRRDPVALAEALARLARDPGLRRRLGRQGQQQTGFAGVYDDAQRLESLYRRALS
jgi:glycosyltransferase involved in cell wall biosynthesis